MFSFGGGRGGVLFGLDKLFERLVVADGGGGGVDRGVVDGDLFTCAENKTILSRFGNISTTKFEPHFLNCFLIAD